MEPSEQDRMFTIEWEMMDKNRFFVLSVANSIALRSVLYPLTVIKTRLQVQKSNEVYRGTFDAFSKIVRQDGVSGLYRGFWVNSMQVVSGIGYLFTYEKTRHLVSKYTSIKDNKIRGLIAGGASSMVSQTIITPFDVVSQHIMVLTGKNRDQLSKMNRTGFNQEKQTLNQSGNKIGKPLILSEQDIRRYGLSLAIIRELYSKDGFKGFYRGYFASLGTYVPSSAIWWMFYPCYSELLCNFFPKETSHMAIQCAAGTLSGASVAVVTNSFDVIRVNIQVKRIPYFKAVQNLWTQERWKIFYKGLSARFTQSCISSFFVSFGYETLKRYSISDQYKDKVRW